MRASTASTSPSRRWRGSPSTTVPLGGAGPRPGRAAPAIADAGLAGRLHLSTHAPAEAQVAAIADDIAYNSHDLDDGLRAGLLEPRGPGRRAAGGPFRARGAARRRRDAAGDLRGQPPHHHGDDRRRGARVARRGWRRSPSQSLEGVRAAGRAGDRALAGAARRDRGAAGLSVRQRLSASARDAR